MDRGGGQGPEAELRRGKKSVSRSVVSDSLPLCGVGCQSPLSLGFSRQEYWSGLPFPFLWDPPVPGIEPESLALQVDSLPLDPQGSPQCGFNLHFFNDVYGGAWWAAVHGVAKSRTQLNEFTFTFHFHALEKELATHSSVLAWRIPGTAVPGGLPSMGSHGVGHD